MTLTSRERVLLALNHQEPDRVPIVFGADGSTAMLVPAYENLKRHLGIECETQLFDRAFQYARIDEEVMVRFEADVRTLVGPASSRCASVDGPNDTFTDCWGVRASEINKSTILLVFWPVFGVAPKVTYRQYAPFGAP